MEEQPRSLRSGGVCGGWVAGSFKSTIFKDLPEAVTGTMVPNVEIDDKNGPQATPFVQETSAALDEISSLDPQHVRW